MTSSAVVNRYANALVDIVVSQSSGIDPALAVSQLRDFEQALKSAPQLGTILASPAVPAARKRLVIRKIADALGMERVIRNFLLVLSDHRRAHALSEMIEAFDVLLDQRLGLLHADVVSAAELTPAQQDLLSAELSKIAASRVRMKFAVDPDLIGGVTARVGAKVYDGSVRGRLEKLRQRLAVQ
jgi:F-type H+-transporting ATPase subunit delta